MSVGDQKYMRQPNEGWLCPWCGTVNVPHVCDSQVHIPVNWGCLCGTTAICPIHEMPKVTWDGGTTDGDCIGTYDQSWFWTKEWQANEREADEQLRNGEYKEFTTMDELLAELQRVRNQ